MSNTLSNMAARLNATRVTADDLLLASSEVHKLPLEDRGWEGRLHLMARLFKGEPEKGFAIEYRLMAMSKHPPAEPGALIWGIIYFTC